MKYFDSKQKKGFTIVEVSLVLAIAGLIFLIVFITLPSLQRGQRDAKRKEDVNTLLTAIKKYQTNNRGTLPNGAGNITRGSGGSTSWGGFLTAYLSDSFKDPTTGSFYTIYVDDCSRVNVNQTCGEVSPTDGKIHIAIQAKCAGDESKGAIKTTNPRKVAAIYRLEGNGTYCANT